MDGVGWRPGWGSPPKFTEKDNGSLANGHGRRGWTPFRLPSVDAGERPHLLSLADLHL